MMREDRQLEMADFYEDGPDFKYQKWKLDARGALVSRYFKEPVFIHQGEQVLLY